MSETKAPPGETTQALIERAERLLRDITPGEWEDGYLSGNGDGVCAGDVLVAESMAPVDAAFIAAAPQLVRDLLAALRAQIGEGRETLSPGMSDESIRAFVAELGGKMHREFASALTEEGCSVIASVYVAGFLAGRKSKASHA